MLKNNYLEAHFSHCLNMQPYYQNVSESPFLGELLIENEHIPKTAWDLILHWELVCFHSMQSSH